MKLTEEQQAQAVAFLSSGMRQKNVAEHFGVSRSVICYVARRAGFSCHNMAPLTPEMEARATTMFREGRSVRYVSRKLAVAWHKAKQLSNKYVLAQYGTTEGPRRLSKLEVTALRADRRRFEQERAAAYRCDLAQVKRIVRSRK